MNTLSNLSSRDFALVKTNTNQNILTTKVKNNCLVLFYTTTCTYCKPVLEIFRSMMRRPVNCNFAIVNISNNREIHLLSQQTALPINYVPFIVYYRDGIPLLAYSGENDERSLLNFITQMGSNNPSNAQFMNGKSVDRNNIPGYTTGIPKNRNKARDVCYLTFDESRGYK